MGNAIIWINREKRIDLCGMEMWMFFVDCEGLYNIEEMWD